MITIPGYEIVTQIYESNNSLVYRGYREHDRQPVILKLLKHEYPTPEQLTRYKQEYEITRSLDLDGAIGVYDLRKYKNTLVMCLEDFGGESLKIFSHSRKLTLAEFLAIAIQSAAILGKLHAANVIHKDINPANIVLNPATGQIKIIRPLAKVVAGVR